MSRSLFVGAVTQACSLRVKLIDFLPKQRLLGNPSVLGKAGVSGRTIDLMQTLAMILKKKTLEIIICLCFRADSLMMSLQILRQLLKKISLECSQHSATDSNCHYKKIQEAKKI